MSVKRPLPALQNSKKIKNPDFNDIADRNYASTILRYGGLATKFPQLETNAKTIIAAINELHRGSGGDFLTKHNPTGTGVLTLTPKSGQWKYGIEVGPNHNVTGAADLVIGGSITTNNTNSILFGVGNSGTSSDSALIGGYNNVASSGDASFLMGSGNTLSNSKATIASGEDNTYTTAQRSILSGTSNVGTSVDDSVLIGNHNSAFSTFCSFLGGVRNTNESSGSGLYFCGVDNTLLSGDAGIVSGYDNFIRSGDSSIVEGKENYVDLGYYSVIGGYRNYVAQGYSSISGAYNIVTGKYAFASGVAVSATGEASHAEGAGSDDISVDHPDHAPMFTMPLSVDGTETTEQMQADTRYTSLKVGSEFGGYIPPHATLWITHIEQGCKRFVSGYTTTNTSKIDLNTSEPVDVPVNLMFSYPFTVQVVCAGTDSSTLRRTVASGYASHAEGRGTTASGYASHSEGFDSTSSGYASHSENAGKASGDYSHAEGWYTIASGATTHAEGSGSTASNNNSHAEGYYTVASGWASHAEGCQTVASGNYSHTEGCGSVASGWEAHAEAESTAQGNYSHTESNSLAIGERSHAEGNNSTAYGAYSHAEGYGTGVMSQVGTMAFTGTTDGDGYQLYDFYGDTLPANPVGMLVINTNNASKGIVQSYKVIDVSAKRIGIITNPQVTFSGNVFNAVTINGISNGCVSIGQGSHSEGYATKAFGAYSHAEGDNTWAIGNASHAEGASSRASMDYSHAEGYITYAMGVASHVGGKGFTSNGGNFNVEISFPDCDEETEDKYLFNTAKTVTRAIIKVKCFNEVSHFTIYSVFGGYSVYSQSTGAIVGGGGFGPSSPTQFVPYEATLTNIVPMNLPANSYIPKPFVLSYGGSYAYQGEPVFTSADADYSFAHGLGVQASSASQTVVGRLNAPEDNKAFVVGNGTINPDTQQITKSNAFTLDWKGNGQFAGKASVDNTDISTYNDNDLVPLGVLRNMFDYDAQTQKLTINLHGTTYTFNNISGTIQEE